MENSSYFIENIALSGGYPIQNQVDALEQSGVRWFINLTSVGEKKIRPYNTHYGYIHYPIPDMYIPQDGTKFATFLVLLGKIIDHCKTTGEKMYMHCKGGHGRSGVVVACLLVYYEKMSVYDALNATREYHANRPNLKEKWLRIGSPQTREQKNFVKTFFQPYCIKRNHPFSTYSRHKVSIPSMGIFSTAEAAYQALKDPEDQDYVNLLLTTDNASIATRIGNSKNVVWDTDKHLDIMNTILYYKLLTNQSIMPILLNTGMRYIIDKRPISYMGSAHEDEEGNIYGRILMEYRQVKYESLLHMIASTKILAKIKAMPTMSI